MTWTIRLRNQPEYASGSQLLAGVDQWTSATMKLSVDGTDVLNLTAPWSAEWLKTAIPRHVLQVTDEIGRVTEWRIIRIIDGRGVGGEQTEVEAESLLAELARPVIRQIQAGGATAFQFNAYDASPEQLFDQFIAPALTRENLTHFVKGTITPTTPLTIAFERFSALELLTEIANRTSSERWVERDSATSSYKINIGTRGSTAPTVRTSFNRGNLQEYRRDRDSLTLATVSLPTGKQVDGAPEKSTLGFAAWRIASATGATFELEDPSGGDGPIAFDDQLNSMYAIRPGSGALVDVTDSSVSGQTVTLASASGFSVGDHIMFVASSSGQLLTELTNPSGISTYGRVIGLIDDEELREERNWIPNPIFGTWSTGNTPDGWTFSNATNARPAKRELANHYPTFFGGSVAGGISGSNPYTFNVSGFAPGRVIERSDVCKVDSNFGYIETGATVSTGGTATISFRSGGTFSVATGQAVLIGKPNTQGSRFANSLSMLADRTLYVESPSIRVRYIEGYGQVWYSAGITYYDTISARSVAALTGVVSLIGTSSTINGTTFVFPTVTEASGNNIAAYDATYRGTATLTANATLSVRIKPQGAVAGFTVPSPRVMIRWVSLTLGSDSQVPPIDGSHGNRIWQRANQQLRLFSTPPTTYSVRLIDLVRARTPGLSDADDQIALGGAVRLIDPQVGEIDLRIVELRLDAANPYLSTVTLASIPPRLAKLAVRDKYAPPVRPDPTPPIEKSVAEQPTAPVVTILAPEIGVTSPTPITLVQGTWSIYS